MQTLFFLKGLPASGKTTWAKKFIQGSTKNSVKRVNKDDLRVMMDNSQWSRGNEEFVLKVRDYIIKQALIKGKHVIVDDTNFEKKHIERVKGIVDEFVKEQEGRQVKIEEKFFDVDINECLDRNRNRNNRVPERVILDMYDKHIYKEEEYILDQDPNLPHCIICDLDGTLALLNGRDPYKPEDSYNDEVNIAVRKIVYNYGIKGKVFFFSGRMNYIVDENTKEWVHDISRLWLKNKAGLDVNINDLVMRRNEDYRKDSVVKQEMFEEHIKGKFFVDFVLDDRDQVVKMWRKLGLTCLQVADGNF